MRTYLGGRPAVDYQVARDNRIWTQHVARTNVTAGLISWLDPGSVLDPACGDGSIVITADRLYPLQRAVLADVSEPGIAELKRGGLPPSMEARCAPAEETLALDESFDVVVLTEILEHVDDPVSLLKAASQRAPFLVASSPEMRVGQYDPNVEHRWMFDGEGYLQVLFEGGWLPFHKTHMGFPNSDYDFQIWVCTTDVKNAIRLFEG